MNTYDVEYYVCVCFYIDGIIINYEQVNQQNFIKFKVKFSIIFIFVKMILNYCE